VLRSFRVANHRSIRDEQELLLMPVYDKARPALPIAAVFGANASGKSNLLDALLFVGQAVRNSYQRWSPTQAVPRQTFRLDQEHRDAPSWYVVEILVAGVRWTYGFEISDERVVEEWLYTYPRNRRRVIFEREGAEFRFGTTVRTSRERSRVLKELTRDNALFISVAAQSGMSDVLPVYRWFAEQLVFPQREPGLDELADYLTTNTGRWPEVRALISAADLGVSGFGLRRHPQEDVQAAIARRAEAEAAAQRSLQGDGTNVEAIADLRAAERQLAVLHKRAREPRLHLLHGANGVEFELNDESAGTLSWLALIPSVLTALEDGRTLLVDELDPSLHPRLLVRLLELFRDPAANTGGGQLIFTTHDASLLGTSFGTSVLERDEVWFVEKSADGATQLIALADFHPRKDENTERRYLGGSYGAVPAVYSDSLVDRLLEARRESSSAAS
jgi:predicted ATPase